METSFTASSSELPASIALGTRRVSALWTQARDARASAVLAHGANNDMRHPFIAGVAESLAREGISVLRFNFPYAEDRRRYPDRPPVLMDTWRAALEEGRRRAEGLPLFSGGKSMGGRIASMVVAEGPETVEPAGLAFFGYPLHPPGRPEQRRDAHLFSIRVPMLFIQGTADALGRLDLIQDLVSRLGAPCELRVIEGADHSFRVRGSRREPADIGRGLGRAAAAFFARYVDAAPDRDAGGGMRSS